MSAPVSVPLISVITPTWQRHELLLTRAVPSVQAQTYPDVEHIIVSDGPDEGLRDLEFPEGVRLDWLPEHPPSSVWGEFARQRGEEIAKGDLLAQLDDDDRLRPQHLTVLAEALERTGADFAYSQMQVNVPSGSAGAVGADPPRYGQIGVSFLYRRRLLEVAGWRPGFATIDWDLVDRWVRAGASWVFVPEVTVDCYPSVYWQ